MIGGAYAGNRASFGMDGGLDSQYSFWRRCRCLWMNGVGEAESEFEWATASVLCSNLWFGRRRQVAATYPSTM